MSLADYEKAQRAIRKAIGNSKTPVLAMIGFLETEKIRLMKHIDEAKQREMMRQYLEEIDEKNFGKGKGVT